jgi:hypothetical protein
MRLDEQHFFVDLVFYNRLLKCFVLIDLKIGDLKHQDLGRYLGANFYPFSRSGQGGYYVLI